MKIKIIFLLIFLFTYQKSTSQAKTTTDGRELIYNVSIGSVIGAIGAVINKKPDENLGKTILKGFSQGGLGGYLTFESKRLIRAAERNDDWKILWGAKLVNAGGNSIKENAALNKNFWEKWHINFGFNRIEFETKDRFKINYKVMPVALVYTIGVASQTKFELVKTLQSGEFIFSSNTDRFIETNSAGIAYPGNIVLYTPYKDNFQILLHEIVHIYQSNDFSQLETFLDKSYNSINTKSEFMSGINKYVHYDFRYLPEVIFHSIDHHNAYYYYDSFLEREAGYFSNTFNANTLK